MPSSASDVQNRAETGMGNLFDGSSNEDLAKAHFKRWRWTAAKPEPDIGSDLVVEIPAKDGQAGATFSVQVRSGNRWKSAETIKRASAARLHGSPLPAFLMYVHRPNGEVRWTYLEPLFETDPGYLDGGGLRVSLSPSRSFPFLSAKPDKAFLDAVMRAKGRSAMKAVGSMGGLARAIHDHYEQLDPALRVSASFVDGRNTLSIAARGAPVTLSMSIHELAEASAGAFRDAVEWGRPAVLEAGALTLTGSPLFDYLTRQNSLTRLEVMPKSVWEGRGMLVSHANDEGDDDKELVDVRITRGTQGGEMALTGCGGLLTLRVRIGRSMKSIANIEVDYDLLYRLTIREMSRAARVMRVLDGAFRGSGVDVQLFDFEPEIGPTRFRWEPTPEESMEAQTFPLRAAIALAYIVTSQALVVEGAPLSRATRFDMEMWIRGEEFLRTGRVELPPSPFFVSSAGPLSLGEHDSAFGNVLVSHHFEVPLKGEVLAELPAWVHFRNFHARVEEPTDGGLWHVRFTPGDGATRTFLPPTDERPEL